MTPLSPHGWTHATPGLALAGAVGLLATWLSGTLPVVTGGPTLPAMILALGLGILFHRIADQPRFEPGLSFCVRVILRTAIAFLGLRIALTDIAALGAHVAVLVVFAMTATLAVAFTASRMLDRGDGYGALSGAANAVCGASATLATATVVPAYPARGADIAFAVIMANLLSTLAMIVYPLIGRALGLDEIRMGILLGATIHDMAQVVGAAYAVSDTAGNAATVVKLFRVLLLLPVVLIIGAVLARSAGPAGPARVPVPTFAFAFILLCLANSAMGEWPALAEAISYARLRAILSQAADIGLLLAIAALGLGTSARSLLSVGWRHIVVFGLATLTTLGIVAAGLAVMA